MMLLAIAGATLCAWAPMPAAAYDADSIVGVWLMDEGNGDLVADFTENGNDGEVISVPDWVDGKFGGALEFAGGVVTIPHPKASFASAFTLTAWVNVPAPTAAWQVIVAQNGPNWPNRSFFLAVSNRTIPDKNNILGTPNFPGSLHWAVVAEDGPQGDEGGPGELFFNTEKLVTGGNWVHVATTYDLENVRVYIDGEQVVEYAFNFKILDSTADIEIGRDLTGSVDDVLVANSAFTADEINSIMELGLEAFLTRDVSASGKLASSWGALKDAPNVR